MALDLESLLAPVSEDDPAGEDLAYDSERMEIERVFDASVSIDASGEVQAGEEVDWRRIIKLIEQQSGRTKDVWLPVYMCRAAARAGDLPTVALGAEYLAGMFERFWDELHPKLDEYGFQGRNGPCDSLTRIGEFLGPLERAAVLQHPRLGSFSGADFERFRANGSSEEGYAQFRAALQDTPEETLLEAAATIERIAEGLRRADAVLTSHGSGGEAANFRVTYDLLAQIKGAVLSFTTQPAAAEQAAADAAGGPVNAVPASQHDGPRVPGRLESREDVLKAIDAITDYYRRQEPASPVLLLMQRAREWVSLDFMRILQDIAPDSVDAVRRVLVFNKPADE